MALVTNLYCKGWYSWYHFDGLFVAWVKFRFYSANRTSGNPKNLWFGSSDAGYAQNSGTFIFPTEGMWSKMWAQLDQDQKMFFIANIRLAKQKIFGSRSDLLNEIWELLRVFSNVPPPPPFQCSRSIWWQQTILQNDTTYLPLSWRFVVTAMEKKQRHWFISTFSVASSVYLWKKNHKKKISSYFWVQFFCPTHSSGALLGGRPWGGCITCLKDN